MRVLITGAARAIGAATAAELTDRGHHVVATSRDAELLATVPAAQHVVMDVTDEASIDAALAEAGELDAVVNNAAISGTGPLEVYPLDELRRMLETNTLGALAVIQKVVGSWRTRGSGVIVNVSSVQGRVATPTAGAYSMSKYALEAMSESLHYELGHFGIRVAIVEPGYIAPGMKAAPRYDGPSDYDEMNEQWEGTDSKVTGPDGRSSSELVGRAIADAIEQPDTPLRVPVGPDAELVLATRSRLDDAAFEAAMRATLDLTW
jgi:NAD(P)-dependent dehydrogenase (short-subunit alcohol dehydrogenase family)